MHMNITKTLTYTHTQAQAQAQAQARIGPTCNASLTHTHTQAQRTHSRARTAHAHTCSRPLCHRCSPAPTPTPCAASAARRRRGSSSRCLANLSSIWTFCFGGSCHANPLFAPHHHLPSEATAARNRLLMAGQGPAGPQSSDHAYALSPSFVCCAGASSGEKRGRQRRRVELWRFVAPPNRMAVCLS